MRVHQRYPNAHFVNQAKKEGFEYEGDHNGDCEVAENAELNDATLDITGNIYISEGVHFGHQVMLLSCSHPIDELDGMNRREKLICKSIHIEKNAYIGSRALILPGVTIGEGAYVGAGAVVTKNVAPFTLVAGFPAKKIKTLKQAEKKEEAPEIIESTGNIDPQESLQNIKDLDTTPPKMDDIGVDPAVPGGDESVNVEVEADGNGEIISIGAKQDLNKQLKEPDAGILPEQQKKERRLPPAGPDNYKDSYANRKARGELTEEEKKKEAKENR